MNTPDFTKTIVVDKSPNEAFTAINNVRGWWSEEIEGNTSKLNDEFYYHYKDIHNCRMQLIEIVPDKKVVWLVKENFFKFTNDQTEWLDTKVIFEISKDGDKTTIHFTHRGLKAGDECYDVCSTAWTDYLENSLRNLIMQGKGKPNPKTLAY